MFTIRKRDRVREWTLRLAAGDERVVGGAVVGSLAAGDGDRWSDLDLTFGVADGYSVVDVLDHWTERLANEFSAVPLFDLPSGASLYRVFLLPGCLQFDLSFTPASAFGAIGPQFKLLFGEAVEKPHIPPPSAHELFGYAVHHAVRARVCIERVRYWQAEYWISGVRDYALSVACLRRQLPSRHAKGVDQLPDDVRSAFAASLVRSLERGELLRALALAVEGLLREAADVPELVLRLGPQLRSLCELQVDEMF
jgi:hypothetical protein